MIAFRFVGDSYIQVVQDEFFEAEVVYFYVDHEQRGKHIGTKLMAKTCKDADREGVTLFIKPYPFGSYDSENETFHPPALTFKQLCKFYRKFGFRFKAGDKERMMRRPRQEN